MLWERNHDSFSDLREIPGSRGLGARSGSVGMHLVRKRLLALEGKRLQRGKSETTEATESPWAIQQDRPLEVQSINAGQPKALMILG